MPMYVQNYISSNSLLYRYTSSCDVTYQNFGPTHLSTYASVCHKFSDAHKNRYKYRYVRLIQLPYTQLGNMKIILY
jgi:hypothetical protein